MSQDHRPDCVQVVIALIITPQSFPLAYEVLAGNTADKTTLREFLSRIEKQYGKARRIWLMDRGIPTEEVLAQMRASDPPVQYLVGTPKGFARTTAAKDHRCSRRRRHPGVVQTYRGGLMDNQVLSLDLPRESAKSG